MAAIPMMGLKPLCLEMLPSRPIRIVNATRFTGESMVLPSSFLNYSDNHLAVNTMSVSGTVIQVDLQSPAALTTEVYWP